ncbi:1-acyl-sn-glycerol-3-phosphate acyltransferase [Vibrio genomosp. F6]|uniref:lysophospholipid acyltransferase family protein n=1 Tax=Vibrio genomosp. F6 TaxID=723172 RepID=UPI0010BDBA2E|nr:lysophospholipid acyltransferase family protein [Vibrio genomosp. F6]TKF22740.1 1-acyl-sn-glycerol-3-phosphate acyltransferase [Vibrio genomosp. F6]
MIILNQYWRILATGICFGIFGIGGLIVSFIILPIVHLSIRDTIKRELKVQSIIQATFHFFCQIMKHSGAIDYKISGLEQLQQDRNCIIVANHPSLIDYVLLASQLKQCDCLVKAAIWENPFIKRIVKAAGYIPNESPENLISTCEQRFERGHILLVFPEGTRTESNVKTKLQRGAAQIAVRTQVDLRVIHITVSPSFLTKEKKWYQVPPTKPFFHLEVKEKIETAPFIESANNLTSAARLLNRHLSEVIFPKSLEKTSYK